MRCGGKGDAIPLIAFQDAPPCRRGNSLLPYTRTPSPFYFMFFLITSANSLAMAVISFCEGPSIMTRQRAWVPEKRTRMRPFPASFFRHR